MTNEIRLTVDDDTYSVLAEAAAQRGVTAPELALLWLHERTAHERERRLGRERPQRPQ